MEPIRAFISEEDGVTAIEYGLIGVLIAVTIIVGVSAVGSKMNLMYSSISSHVLNAIK